MVVETGSSGVGLWAGIGTIIVGLIYLAVAKGLSNGNGFSRLIVAIVSLVSIIGGFRAGITQVGNGALGGWSSLLGRHHPVDFVLTAGKCVLPHELNRRSGGRKDWLNPDRGPAIPPPPALPRRCDTRAAYWTKRTPRRPRRGDARQSPAGGSTHRK